MKKLIDNLIRIFFKDDCQTSQEFSWSLSRYICDTRGLYPKFSNKRICDIPCGSITEEHKVEDEKAHRVLRFFQGELMKTEMQSSDGLYLQ